LDFEDAQSRDVVQLWPVEATIKRVLARPIDEFVTKGKGLDGWAARPTLSVANALIIG